MDEKTPRLETTFRLSEEDFYNFNWEVSRTEVEKGRKRVRLLGIVEIAMAGVAFAINIFREGDGMFLMILALALLLTGALSIFLQPMLFERQMRKAVANAYVQDAYFQNPVTLKFFKTEVHEHSLEEMRSIRYSELDGIREYGGLMVLQIGELGGILIPLREIGENTAEEIRHIVNTGMEIGPKEDEETAQLDDGGDPA